MITNNIIQNFWFGTVTLLFPRAARDGDINYRDKTKEGESLVEQLTVTLCYLATSETCS